MLLFPHLEEVGLTCAVSTKPINVREAEDRDRFVAALGLDPARAVSAPPNFGTVPSTDPSAGLVTSTVAPSSASHQEPAIWAC